MSRLNWLGRKSIMQGSWLARLTDAETEDARRDRPGQQDGTDDLGPADKE